MYFNDVINNLIIHEKKQFHCQQYISWVTLFTFILE